MKNDMEKEIRKLVCETLEITDMSDFADTDDLEELGLDSLNCISLIISIENYFDIEISDEDLGMQHVSSISKICELIMNYIE